LSASSSSSSSSSSFAEESGIPSELSPPGAFPSSAKAGGSGEFGYSGNGSLTHGEIHFLLSYVFYKTTSLD